MINSDKCLPVEWHIREANRYVGCVDSSGTSSVSPKLMWIPRVKAQSEIKNR